MNNRDPFTPEERDLASLLPGRRDATPSPDADAAIIAAARASLQNEAQPHLSAQERPAGGPRRHRRRARWPTLLGLAASVVVAVGLAWHLRPDPPPTTFAAVMREPLPVPVDKAEPGDAVPAPAPLPVPASVPAGAAADHSAPGAAPPAAAPAAASSDVPSAGREPAPAAARAESRAAVASPPPQALHRVMPRPLSAGEVSAAVQADAQLSRRQWLQRIRNRRDAGNIDVARASLEHYLEEYPGTRIPRDLQALLSQ